MFLSVPRIAVGELDKPSTTSTTSTKTSVDVRQIVEKAHQKQKRRFQNTPIFSNAEMSNRDIEQYTDITPEAHTLAITSVERLHLSTRVYYRILRLARTIADIE